MNLITQYGLRVLALALGLGLGLVLYYECRSPVCVPSSLVAASCKHHRYLSPCTNIVRHPRQVRLTGTKGV